MNYDSNRDNVDLFFDEMNRPQETVTKGSYFPRSSLASEVIAGPYGGPKCFSNIYEQKIFSLIFFSVNSFFRNSDLWSLYALFVSTKRFLLVANLDKHDFSRKDASHSFLRLNYD